MLMTPKIKPFFDRIVRYEPPALPGTGILSDAAVSRACIFAIEPIFGDVA